MSRPKGGKLSVTHRENIARSLIGKNKGKKHSEEFKLQCRERKLGVRLSEDTKKKIGEKNKGKKHSEAFIQNCRARNLGTKRSTVTKQKMKESNSKYWLGKKRLDMVGENNPMHKYPNLCKYVHSKGGFRKDIGIYVRSSWEANICRIYRYLGYTVIYEPKSFKLSDGKTYRPDFYIVELDLWIEVKGRWYNEAKIRFDLFIQEYPNIKIQVIEQKQYSTLIELYKYRVNIE